MPLAPQTALRLMASCQPDTLLGDLDDTEGVTLSYAPLTSQSGEDGRGATMPASSQVSLEAAAP